MKTTFIYALNDPETGGCRYVGKADDPHDRLFGDAGHLYEARSKKKPNHRTNWIKALVARGLVPLLEILQEVPDTEWELWERVWIKASRVIGMDLTNIANGGDAPPSRKGKKHKPESLAKMSVAQKGKKQTATTIAKRVSKNRGQKRTAAQCKNLSVGMLGKKMKDNTSGFSGVGKCATSGKWSARITVNKRRVCVGFFKKIEDAVFAQSLAKATGETCLDVGASKRGKKHTPAHNEKIGDAQRGVKKKNRVYVNRSLL